MIDFRYHVVSLVAVLLALATGILVGSSVLAGPLYDSLTKRTDQLAEQTDHLRSEIQTLQRTERFGNAFADEVAGELVVGRLAAETAVLVGLPGADQRAMQATAEMIERAGGEVTGTVRITSRYGDREQEPVLDDLVNLLAPAGTDWPADSSVTDRAALELAMALVTDQGSRAGDQPGSSFEQILPGMAEAGFIELPSKPRTLATVAVLVAGEPPEAGSPERESVGSYAELAGILDEHSQGLVVAGPVKAAETGGVVAAVRSNGNLAKNVSTIDVVDTPIGRIGVVYALVEQTLGESGQYGISGTTDGPLPDLTKEGGS